MPTKADGPTVALLPHVLSHSDAIASSTSRSPAPLGGNSWPPAVTLAMRPFLIRPGGGDCTNRADNAGQTSSVVEYV